MVAVTLSFFDCVEEIKIMIPMNIQKVPTFLTERALRHWKIRW
jgi:hypothetical protein